MAIYTEAFGPDHDAVGMCWLTLSQAYEADGRLAEAIGAVEKAVATGERGGQEEFGAALSRVRLGELRWRLGEDRAAARTLVEQAGATMAKTPEREPAEQARVRAWLQAHALPE